MKKLTISAALALLATPVLAHPGHDAPPATHWIADLPHLAVTMGVAALAVVVVAGIQSRRRAKSRRAEE